ncbi:hypothetical protein J437_LFUL005455, partial [Ladona fulva]
MESHVLPAKEKMNPSFQNKSSSDEISETDAFVQISKEDNLVGGNKSFELVEPSSCSQLKDEVRRANMDEWTDLSCKIPTDQVPALKETTDCTELEGCSGIANLAAVGNNLCAQTLVHAAANELYSKEEDSMQPHQLHHNLQHSTQVWPLVPKAASSHHDNQNCACESQDKPPGSVMSCQCLQFQNHLNAKGEAGSSKISPGQHLQQPIIREVVIGGVVRGAGAGPNLPEPNDHHRHHLTVSEVDSSFSESVISSSISAAVKDVNFPPSPPTSSSPTTPPSLCGSSGTNIGSTCSAEQTSNANLVIHHGSSCSESLLHAQIQSETLGALSTQASENPVNSSEVQNQETVMQPSVNSSLGNREGNCSSSSNICINLKGPQITSNVKQIGAHSDIPISAAVAGRQYYPKNEGIIKSSFIKLRCGGLPKQLSKSSYPQGPASNEGWGIPSGLGLLGGGESSLNSGTSGWGTPPSSNPNNNSGWGQNSSQNPAQSQWGGGSVNRNGGGASQGPAGQQNAGNSNKGNQQTHQQSHNQGGGPQQQQSGQSSTSVSSRDNQGQQGGGQNNSQQQQGNNGPTSQSSQSQQQQNGSTSWAQAAGKGLPGGQSTQGSGGGGGGGSGGNGGPNGGSTSNSTTKQLEQLNSMREALFSQDGWGGQHVNQDTGWDIPASPEPGAKDSGAVWKPNVNNGTDLWEANLRNGGQPPPQQAQKTPWGHTPATNIGGTWGEDDDVGDSSNVWTGVPSSGGGTGAGGPGMGTTGGPGGGGPGPGGAGAGGQWTSSSGGGAMWGAKKEPEWGAAGSNWGDSRDSRELRGGDPRDIRGGDPRDIRDMRELRDGNIRGGGDHRGVVDNRGVDPRDLRDLRDPLMRDMRDIRDLPRELRGTGTAGDPCMGRINGSELGGGGPAAALAAAAMWGQQKGVGAAGGGVVGGPSQWAGPPPPQAKDMKPTGWEEPSPPTQRRNIPNYDDGTSLWGNPTQQPGKGETRKVSHWKEMPTPNMGRGGMQCPPGISQNRLPSGGSGGMKGDAGGPQWGHPS